MIKTGDPMKREQLFWEDVTVGEDIPTGYSLKLDMSRFVLQVSGTQDWYPVHHDRDFARSQGVPDVFMNTGFLTAATGRIITDWIGPCGWLKKYSIQMRKMNLLGETMHVKGTVTKKYIVEEDHVVEADVWCETDGQGITTPCTATVILPTKKRLDI
jgi:acyl dehydratase